MRRFVLTACIMLTSAGMLSAQQVGTIVVAHGGGPEWNQLVYAIADSARTGGPLEVSFLMGPGAKTTRIQDVASRMAATGVSQIVIVPLLVSSSSGHYEQIRYLAGETDELSENMKHHLHMGGLERIAVKVPVRVARAIDDSPDVARVLSERARELISDPSGRALFLIGHGPNSSEDLAIWMKNLRTLADSVRALTGFRDVRVGLVQDDAPAHVRAEAVTRVRELIELQHQLTGQDVAVVPVLVAKGKLSAEKLPQDLAGLPILYNGEPLLPHPMLARWIESRVREVPKLTLSQ